MNRVIVTGAAGHLGKKVFNHLKGESGYQVIGLDIRDVPEPDIHVADFSEYGSWIEHLNQGDIVIHLAADREPTATWGSAIHNNINGTLNLFQACAERGVKRLVFASSNWVHGGYRFSDEVLTPSLPAYPVNAYGSAKLFGELAGKHFSKHHGLSVICLRIGWTQWTHDNQPGEHMAMGIWGQEMWLSDRDFLDGVQKSVDAHDMPYAIINLVSNNRGMRWDIESTKQVIGYKPQDSFAPSIGISTKIKSVLKNALVYKLPRFFDRIMAEW